MGGKSQSAGPGRTFALLQEVRVTGLSTLSTLSGWLPVDISVNRLTQRGQGMVEYSFILVLIALVVIVMLATTGKQVRNLFSDVTYTLHNEAGLYSSTCRGRAHLMSGGGSKSDIWRWRRRSVLTSCRASSNPRAWTRT